MSTRVQRGKNINYLRTYTTKTWVCFTLHSSSHILWLISLLFQRFQINVFIIVFTVGKYLQMSMCFVLLMSSYMYKRVCITNFHKNCECRLLGKDYKKKASFPLSKKCVTEINVLLKWISLWLYYKVGTRKITKNQLLKRFIYKKN